MHSYSQLMW